MVSRNSAFALTVMLLFSSSAQSMSYLPSLPSLPSCASLKSNASDATWFTAKVAAAMIAAKFALHASCYAWNKGRSLLPATWAAKVPAVQSSCAKQACLNNRVATLEQAIAQPCAGYNGVCTRLSSLERSTGLLADKVNFDLAAALKKAANEEEARLRVEAASKASAAASAAPAPAPAPSAASGDGATAKTLAEATADAPVIRS